MNTTTMKNIFMHDNGGMIAMPTITSMRDLLDRMQAEQGWSDDQHIEMKPIGNMLGTFVVKAVNPAVSASR